MLLLIGDKDNDYKPHKHQFGAAGDDLSTDIINELNVLLNIMTCMIGVYCARSGAG